MASAADPVPSGGEVAGGEVAGGELADRISYRFQDPALLEQAMAHRSWCAEQPGRQSNERLEFLGDAVLGLVVAEYTYRSHPELSDGEMSKVRASVVNTRVLGEVGLGLGIDQSLYLGRGEDLSGGRHKESILADATEAVIGALYLDGGLDQARRLVLSLLEDRIAVAVGEPGESDHKSRLQELAVRLGRGVPHYEMEGFGPDHARRYLATVYVAGQRLGTGEGRSKKDAEQVAAQAACESLEVERGGGDA
jgi:ribonuclease III